MSFVEPGDADAASVKALAEQVASQFGPVLGFPAEVTYVSDSEEYPYVEGGTADEVLRFGVSPASADGGVRVEVSQFVSELA